MIARRSSRSRHDRQTIYGRTPEDLAEMAEVMEHMNSLRAW